MDLIMDLWLNHLKLQSLGKMFNHYAKMYKKEL